MAVAAFMALSASALARSSHELEVEPRNSPASAQWPEIELAWPQIEVAPTSPVLRSSPSVSRMHLSKSQHEPALQLEPALLS
jgi:hypothetical protein